MNSQKERLSYDRLISRTQYYQEKTLDLERKLVFAEETIERLQSELKAASREKELEEKEMEIQKLKVELENVYSQLNEAKKVNHEQRILDYEDLLSKIQVEINEKDQLLESYQQRIKGLEKRLNLRKNVDRTLLNFPENGSGTLVEKADFNSICYFNSSVIFNENRTGIIKGSFHMENTGIQPLENPYICFRFQPEEACILKGKIFSPELHTANSDQLANFGWMFMDNEWANAAKERGEIWICPIQETKILPGESLAVQDFQIPFKKDIDHNIIVEAFVFYNKQQYKVKAVNHIAVNF
ncbi:hypothetical protein WD019_00740 [Fictibacillus sp. Mic-4]|uniref:hypothetical protein n=1 Tax=Fictibacillus TaxID=1329200 RepID=UPI00047E8B17|nr:hypothetical protein [Fictibacillus gelatini]